MSTTLTDAAPQVAQPTPPPPPATIADSGLNPEALAQLLLKTLLGGEASGSTLADKLKVPYSLLEALIQHARIEKLVEVRGASGVSSFHWFQSPIAQTLSAAGAHTANCVPPSTSCAPSLSGR